MEFRNAVYSSGDGQQIDMEINHPVYGWIPFTARPDDPEQHGRDLYAEALLGTVAPYVAPEPPPPILTPPKMVSCALRVAVTDGEVSAIGGSFNVMTMIRVDVGTFWVFCLDEITGDEPELVPNNGIHIAITEWSGSEFFIECRDHAGGSLIDPASFGFTLYQF